MSAAELAFARGLQFQERRDTDGDLVVRDGHDAAFRVATLVTVSFKRDTRTRAVVTAWQPVSGHHVTT
jgi:hypothetical protein